MKRFLVIFLLLSSFAALNLDAQWFKNTGNIDSLKNEITKDYPDSTIVKITCRLATSYIDVNKDTAIFFAKQALKKAKSTGDKKLMGRAYHFLGFIHNQKANYNKSIKILDTAIKLYTAVDYEQGLGEVLSVYGLSNWRVGQYDKSLVAYNQILSMANKPELARSKLAATINSALIYEEQFRNDEAEILYIKAISLAKAQEDLYGEMVCYNNLSSLSRFKKEFKKSVSLSQKAIELATTLKNKGELHRAVSNLGATYVQMDILDSAEHYLLESYYIGVSINDEARLVKTTWHLSELYIKKGNYAEAKKYAQESLTLGRKTETLEDLAFGYEALYEIEKKQKNYALAVQMADSVIYWKDSLYKASNIEALANAESGYNNKILLKENQRLDEERKYLRNIMIGLVALLGLLIFALWTFLKRKASQKQLDIEMRYSQMLTASIEAYRKKRATELHDDVGQDLLLAQQSMQLNNTKEKTKEFIERALNKVRKISKDEYPYELSYIGLKASLEYLIDLIEQNAEIIISDELCELPLKIPAEQSLNIYRIIQEMLNNSIKNPDTAAVFIGMKIKDALLQIDYKDNGSGFNFDKQLIQSESIGLKSIVNRVRMLKGSLKKVPSEAENNYIIQVPFDE